MRLHQPGAGHPQQRVEEAVVDGQQLVPHEQQHRPPGGGGKGVGRLDSEELSLKHQPPNSEQTKQPQGTKQMFNGDGGPHMKKNV